jgi:hypothetical protein
MRNAIDEQFEAALRQQGLFADGSAIMTLPDNQNAPQLPFREVYPSSSKWGTSGFTYTANSHPQPLEAARAKMKELL